ncbi:type-2 ice-structuring protein-like [Hypomesus transpacificus]|uniref:type-2 ice-structuring protein-like n=1 Tax=Hypomesus transpacificus TaxID=137520 RepID=UPI001F076514|nr:type-2 ice-structuring protein-like [Hypomesus transpacificus]
MQGKSRSVDLLVLLLCGATLTSALVRETFEIDTTMNCSDAEKYCRQYFDGMAYVHEILDDGWGLAWLVGFRSDNMLTSWTMCHSGLVSGNCTTVGNTTVLCESHRTVYCHENMREIILVDSPMTFDEAVAYCRNEYTDMLSIRSLKEHTIALRKMRDAKVKNAWIGLRFVGEWWMWLNGDPLEYVTWKNEELSTCPAEKDNCGILLESEVWDSSPCDLNESFLCYNE